MVWEGVQGVTDFCISIVVRPIMITRLRKVKRMTQDHKFNFLVKTIYDELAKRAMLAKIPV